MNKFCALVGIILVASEAFAGVVQPSVEFNPQPPVSGLEIAVGVSTGYRSCFNEIASSNLVRSGNILTLEYDIQETSGTPVCAPTPPPLRFSESLGALDAGEYELVLIAVFRGAEQAPVSFPFGVVQGSLSVHAGGGPWAFFLILLIASVGLYASHGPGRKY